MDSAIHTGWPAAFLTGFLLSFGLIVAIGAQNAFVLRQGLRREHVTAVIGFCVVADIVLIAAGVAGLAPLVNAHEGVARAAAVGGAVFLAWHGVAAARRAWDGTASLQHGPAAPPLPVGAVIAQVAAFTFLNPHTWLDTVVLVGSVGAQQPVDVRWVFVAGASVASLVWFVGLGHGARWLAPLFARPAAWRVLDAFIASTLLLLSAGLALHAATGMP